MSDEPTLGPPPKDGSAFRAVIGLLALAAEIGALAGLYFIEIPTGNRDALMLALGIIIGWGSSVFSSEYGASSTGRRSADATIKRMERSDAVPPV